MKSLSFIILSIFLATAGFAQKGVVKVSSEKGKNKKSEEFYQVLRIIIDAASNEFESIKGQELKNIVGTKYKATVEPPNALVAYVENNIWPTYHAMLHKSSRYRPAKKAFEDYEQQIKCDLIQGWYIYESQSYSDKLMVYSVGTEANKMRGTEVTLTLRKNYDGIYVVELDVVKK